MEMKEFLSSNNCPCGKEHKVMVDAVVFGKNAISKLPEFVYKYNAKKPFLLADRNTFAAAGEKVCSVLETAGIAYKKYIFNCDELEPNEQAVGSAVMHYDYSCDLIIGIGSGVVNDISKILSCICGKKFIIVCTAPSMDGYVSPTSSMSLDGLKQSLNTRCADVIIGDIDVLKNAPDRLLRSGLGDMLAKYVSIAEWRIGHLITGEYYCEQVADLIRQAVKKCVDNAGGLLRRDETAIEAVFEGLVLGGVAMAYAGISRPASGVEHYFSHIWDMRGLEFGTPVDLHGIQCAVGTYLAAKLYDELKKIIPDMDKATESVRNFSYSEWQSSLRQFLGSSAETMISQEQREQKYNKTTHAARLHVILKNWDSILQILQEELPSAIEIEKILDAVGLPKDYRQLGIDRDTAKMTFKVTKDIRDKYVLSRLAWDLGVLDELCDYL
ncbi:MAG: sn-glycerol-1-phosphate dehydrogenase [Oscillospiraceae bacterium]|nr:sn-glycerol-1-phosphate dehydrogenase [Oscillospiraceae bacterium]